MTDEKKDSTPMPGAAEEMIWRISVHTNDDCACHNHVECLGEIRALLTKRAGEGPK